MNPQNARMLGNLSKMTRSPRSEQIALQLRALMDRHGLPKAPDLSRLLEKKGTPIDYVTINRMLGAEAKTEPRPDKLRAIAAAVGEDYDEAFPEKPNLVVEVGGRKIALKALDGEPITAADLKLLRSLRVDHAQEIHELKKTIRKKP